MQAPGDAQMRVMARMQVGVFKKCFDECVSNFSAPELSSSESSCIKNCGLKQMNTLQMFGDAQNQAMQKMQGGMGGQF